MEKHDQSLTLCLTRQGGQPAAAGLQKRFDERGGTIGRAAQNDWVLPDPTRYLSAHHATVYFEQGRFHLVDCSRNGVFVNGQEQALGIERIATLTHGDRLQMGDCDMVVELLPAAGAMSAKLDPLQLLAGAAAATRGDATPVSAVVAGSGSPERREASWPGLDALPQRNDLGLGDEVVDPRALLGAASSARPLQPEIAAQRNDGPVMATPFQPPAVQVALPDDWLEPVSASLPAPSLPRAPLAKLNLSAPPAPDVAKALQIACTALREALAALEGVRAAVRTVPSPSQALNTTEAARELE